jgi:hypothetical protein
MDQPLERFMKMELDPRMISPNKKRPRWWPLYLIMALVFGLFLFEVRAPLSVIGHRAVEIGLVLLACGSTQLWVQANPVELIEENRVYKPHYTWIEEPPERQPLVVEKPGLSKSQPGIGLPIGEKADLPVQETFLSYDLDSVRAQVLSKN